MPEITLLFMMLIAEWCGRIRKILRDAFEDVTQAKMRVSNRNLVLRVEEDLDVVRAEDRGGWLETGFHLCP